MDAVVALKKQLLQTTTMEMESQVLSANNAIDKKKGSSVIEVTNEGKKDTKTTHSHDARTLSRKEIRRYSMWCDKYF